MTCNMFNNDSHQLNAEHKEALRGAQLGHSDQRFEQHMFLK